ncbi:MAG: DNA gyrase inhibitor YacG [Gammaproteobacteria bacterium]|nr:DNA gyrase inhibitor YacG [Gammaproteobacteria bacterium]
MTTTGRPETKCPTCKKRVIWNSESRWRPFCSERCRLIDLGEWLDESHRINAGAADYSLDLYDREPNN